MPYPAGLFIILPVIVLLSLSMWIGDINVESLTLVIILPAIKCPSEVESVNKKYPVKLNIELLFIIFSYFSVLLVKMFYMISNFPIIY